MRRWLTPLRIAVALGLILAAARFYGILYLSLSDQRLMDFRLLQRGALEPGSEVAIVAIDDRSIAEIGRWPWPRTVIAHLVDELVAGEPAIIAFDVVFSEPSAFAERRGLSARPDGIDNQSWRATQATLQAQDATLATALERSQRAVLGYFVDFDASRAADQQPPPESYALVRGTVDGAGEAKVPHAVAIVGNLPEYDAAASAIGYFNETPDADGYVRRLPLVIAAGPDEDMAVPLELATLRLLFPEQTLSLQFKPFGVETLRFGGLDIPVDESGRMLINYRGPARTFPHLSAADVLAGQTPREALRDKILLIGATATAVADVRVTPFDEIFPGVEIHANAIDNILRGDFIHQPKWLVLVDCAVIAGLALILGIAMKRVRGVPAALLAITLMSGYLVISQQIFVRYGWPLSFTFPALTILLIYSAIAVEQYVTEEREKRKVRRALDLYLSPSMARLVSEQPENLKLGGEKRELTVLFSDIRSFTPIAERLSPEALVELLNEYLGAMTDIVFDHEGMLDKYMGDAVMAIWGAPLPQPDHGARACRAALDMMRQLEKLNQHWQRRGWDPLRIGIGLSSGPMAFGNMGSAQHLSLTVMGDNVNLGSRLEGLSKYYGTTAIASATTVGLAGDAIVARELDLVRVKGKQEAVQIYDLLDATGNGDRWRGLIQQFAAALQLYRSGQWQKADEQFADILRQRPDDGPARLFRQRCQRWLRERPDTWDHIAVFE